MPRLRLTTLMAALGSFLMSSAVLANDADTRSFDCRQLADQADGERPEAPAEWLRYSLQASHCFIFKAQAVRISNEGVRTLALSHDIDDGIISETASYLDGAPVIREHQGRLGVANSGAMDNFPASILSRVENHYRIALEDQERIADRPAVRLDIEPLDNLRYGHRLWLDRQTGLPLKQVLIGVDGRALETFQLTELQSPRLYEGEVSFVPLHESNPGPWQPGWLPSGYVRLPMQLTRGIVKEPLGHYLYSDGLSSFSIFIEPLDGRLDALLPGLHRLGISHAVVRQLRLGEQVMQVVVMGEVPPQVLGRVAARLGYRPSGPASTEAAGTVSAESRP